MKLPKLGLFSRFFALFSITTILLALCLSAAYVVINEDEAIKEVKARYNFIIALLENVDSQPITPQQLDRYGEQIKGQISIELNGVQYSNDPKFPSAKRLLEDSMTINELYFSKYRSKYYVLYQLPNGWAGITSTPFNLMVYSNWLAHWPWVLAILILSSSYFILRKLLSPIFESLQAVKQVSTGDFSYQINKHPNNELAELTHGINQMSMQLKQMFNAKNELLLAISHELRTPLARMNVSLSLAEKTDHIEGIKSDLDQMERLIGQLLENERLQAGHRALHLTTIYLPSLIGEVIDEDPSFAQVHVPKAIPDTGITVDVGRFKFVIRNLIHNALKHNLGKSQISLLTYETNDQIVFNISDCGKGIPQQDLPHIFEPFYCVDRAGYRNTRGTGLGLFLCKAIIQAHGGTISVTSEVDKGTCFTVSLPVITDFS